MRRFVLFFLALAALLAFPSVHVLRAQALTAGVAPFAPLPRFPMDGNPLVLTREARPNLPFSVVGPRGAILGQQDGVFELWSLPVKVLHEAHLSARVEGYDVPIDLNECAATIEVRPDHTTVTYAHAAITVRQHMFIPHTAANGIAAAVVLFEVHAIGRAELTLSFAPSMERMWPAPNFGRPNGSWVPYGTGGAFALETDNPGFFGFVAMPNASPGPIRPYQERPKTEPLAFRFHYDPAVNDAQFYPLLTAVSDGGGSGAPARTALLERLMAAAATVPALYSGTAAFYATLFDRTLTLHTPDAEFNDALRWATVSIEQSRVVMASGSNTASGSGTASKEASGLAGGWFTSGDSARPGFGWFFGRDTLWTLFAVNSFGDFALSRSATDFLLAHQRADGKMMHEYSQTATDVDWAHLPYLYAAADATPLFVMEMEDYVRASGDLDYLRRHWDNVRRAFAFTRAHTTDGVYDNTEGTGWVEEWVPKLPHQEIYLAALDQQSAESFSRLALLMGDRALSAEARGTADAIRAKLAGYRGADGTYAFSRNADGTYEAVPTIFPAVAWWSGHLALPAAAPTFRGWDGPRFATDWGLRSVATDAAIYDPISYHHGSVWPLYTGWVAMAQYRTGRAAQAFANLQADARLTTLEDPGAITEVISGEFLEPLGRSSSHQLWSSAMLLAPAVRGLLGLEVDALNHTLRLAPQLPAAWDEITADYVRVGDDSFHIAIERRDGQMELDVSSGTPTVLCLAEALPAAPCTAKPERHHLATRPLPPVEVSLPYVPAREGARTGAVKLIEEERTGNSLVLTLAAPAASTQTLRLRVNGRALPHLSVDGGTLSGGDLAVAFDQDATGNYKQKTVAIRW